MRAFRLNLLCILGASLGIAALFIGFLSPDQSLATEPGGVRSIFLGSVVYLDYRMAVPVVLLIVGSALAFLTPIGGIFQGTGLGLLSYSFLFQRVIPDQYHIGYGFVLSLLSCILVLLSFRVSLWFVHEGSWSDRLLTSHSVRNESAGTPSDGKAHKGQRRFTRVNLLCLIGAAIGLFSLVLAWTETTWPFQPNPEAGGLMLGSPTWAYVPSAAGIAIGLYAIGTIIAFVTPVGGALQMAGAFSFLMLFIGRLGANTSTYIGRTYDYTISLNIGFYLAVFAAALVLASIAFQRHLPDRFGSLSSSRSFWTWSSDESADGAPDSSPLSRNVNVISLLGSLTGVVALFGAWFTIGPFMMGKATILCPITIPTFGHESFLENLLFSVNTYVQLGAILFLAGTFLSLASQLGGALQVGGVISFLGGAWSLLNHGGGQWTSRELGIGFFMAVAAGALVVIGAVKPVFFNSKSRSSGELGSLLVPSASSGAQQDSAKSQGKRVGLFVSSGRGPKLRVNLLCLLGAVLGFVSLELVWGYMYGVGGNFLLAELWRFIMEGPLGRMTMSIDMLAQLAFIIGCAISLISPLGGLLELGGMAAFLLRFNQIYSNPMPFPGQVLPPWNVGVGVYVGLASVAIVLVSMILPLGLQLRGRAPRGLARLSAWSVRPVGAPMPAEQPAKTGLS